MPSRWTEVKRLFTPKILRKEAVAARKAANKETGKFFAAAKTIGARYPKASADPHRLELGHYVHASTLGGYKKTRKNKKRTKNNIRSRKHRK